MAQYVTVTLDAMEAARRRSEMVDAVYKTGTILGLGGLLYLGWWMYEFSSDIQKDTQMRLAQLEGEFTPVAFPAVNPWLAGAEASARYAELLNVDPRGAESVTQSLLGGNVLGRAALAATEKLMPGTEAYARWSRFDRARSCIQGDGTVLGYSAQYYAIKDAEAALVAAGVIDRSQAEEMHPVDVVANFVVHNKWYWGGVLGLASLPALGLGLRTVREITSKELEDVEGR